MACFYRDGGKMIEGPVKITVWAFMKIPAHKSKKAAAAMAGTWCEKKPDVDNILKIVMDGLQGAAFADDKQVVEATVTKVNWPEAKVVVNVEEAR